MSERFDPQVLTHLAAFLRVESLTRLPETHGSGCEKDSFVLLKKTIEREAYPMAREITGDITAITDGYIMHQVNCQNVMGAGVAKSLATKYPEIKEAFHAFAKTYTKPKERFGWIQPVRINDNLVICNSFSQFSFGNSRMTGICYTDMLTLKSALKRFDARAKKAGKPAYVPAYIGCGLAGGDWTDIRNFILNETDITIVAYRNQYQKRG